MGRLIGKRKMVRKLLAPEQLLISHLKIDQGLPLLTSRRPSTHPVVPFEHC